MKGKMHQNRARFNYNFTYKYKYSRKLGHPNGDYRSVPLVPEVLEDQASERLKTRVPAVWKLITEFRQAKTNGE